MKELEEHLHQRVIGQEKAVKKVAKAVRRSRAGLKSKTDLSAPSSLSDRPESEKPSYQRHSQMNCSVQKIPLSVSI